MQVMASLAGNDLVATGAADQHTEHGTALQASLSRFSQTFSSLQQSQAATARQSAAAANDADTSLTAVTVHRYPVDKQLLLQVRLRQGRMPATVVCTPAEGIAVVPAGFGKVSPSHVGPAAHKDSRINSAANTSPVAYRASVYRALQLHDSDARNSVALSPSPTASECHIPPTTLPHFQSLHEAGSTQPAAVNGDEPFAVGLEQHLITDPSIHENDVPAPDIACVEHKPIALCVQPQKPEADLGADYTSATSMKVQAVVSHITSSSPPNGHRQVGYFLHSPTQKVAQPAPAFAWSTEQLTAIATAAATAAAAAFQQQTEHRMQQSNACVTDALTVHHAQQAAHSAALSLPVASADLAQQGFLQHNQTQPYSADTSVATATAAAQKAVQLNSPRAAQPLRQQKQQQQQRAMGQDASSKQAMALHKLKRRTSALRASTGSHRGSIELAVGDAAGTEQAQALALNAAAAAFASPAIEVQPQKDTCASFS